MTTESGSLFPLTDENGNAPIYGYRCSPDCLAFQGYGHHVNCQQVEMVPARPPDCRDCGKRICPGCE